MRPLPITDPDQPPHDAPRHRFDCWEVSVSSGDIILFFSSPWTIRDFAAARQIHYTTATKHVKRWLELLFPAGMRFDPLNPARPAQLYCSDRKTAHLAFFTWAAERWEAAGRPVE